MSSVPPKADKLNLSLSLKLIYFGEVGPGEKANT